MAQASGGGMAPYPGACQHSVCVGREASSDRWSFRTGQQIGVMTACRRGRPEATTSPERRAHLATFREASQKGAAADERTEHTSVRP